LSGQADSTVRYEIKVNCQEVNEAREMTGDKPEQR
jgi:hypothetical protein